MVMGSFTEEADVVVIGAGPGGYVAAIQAANLGKDVVLIEERERQGGVCLIEGCIPSKTLIHAVEVANEAREAKRFGVHVEGVRIDPEGLRAFKQKVVDGLTGGVAGLLKARNVEIKHGRARFEDSKTVAIEGGDRVTFKHCIIATGSRVIELPMTKDLPIWTSREALDIPTVPATLLVVGGGYIGMELGLVYAGLGSQVTVVEFLPEILAAADSDLVRVVQKSAERKLHAIHLNAKVVDMKHDGKAFTVKIDHSGEVKDHAFDQVLVCVGRRPNTDTIGLENTKVKLDDKGFIIKDEQCRTDDPTIFAIGDCSQGVMLAHKASREGKVAAEVIAGQPSAADNVSVPAVVFTDPELAWVGITEKEAKAAGRAVAIAKFPFAALGRAKSIGKTEGQVKIISDPESQLVLGVGIVGVHASDLIAECTLALEMGATLEDVASTIHAHPTLSEAFMEAADVALGHPIHISLAKKK